MNGKKYVNCYLKAIKMSSSIKLKDNNYWDSKSIVHNKELLEAIINGGRFIHNEITSSNEYDWDNIMDSTQYGIILTKIHDAMTKKGAPIDAYAWGLLVSIRSNSIRNYYPNVQIYIPDMIRSNENLPKIYIRTFNSTKMNSWVAITASEIVSSVGY